MRIVIATGIFPPEIGGPAYYAAALRDALERQGHAVTVVLPAALKRRLPPLLWHVCYAAKLMPAVWRSDVVIAFDTWGVGAPATFACLVAGRPFVVRIGGDAMWEAYTARTNDPVPLPSFYAQPRAFSAKERLMRVVTRWVLRHATAVFSSDWQRRIWQEPYALDTSRTRVIENAVSGPCASVPPIRKNYILFSRPVAFKNVAAFERAMADAKRQHPDIELETGTVPHDELLRRTSECYAVALPSVSDITPNYILDAIAFRKPFLLTRYSAYAETFGEYGVIVDPLDHQSMVDGIVALADPATYQRLAERMAAFDRWHSYDDIAREFVALAQELRRA